jgi:hypothetical protein
MKGHWEIVGRSWGDRWESRRVVESVEARGNFLEGPWKGIAMRWKVMENSFERVGRTWGGERRGA